MKNALLLIAVAAIVSLMVAPTRAADINVGLITAMTGPGASIGIPYAKGAAAGVAYKDGVDGTKLNLIELDDATDPSNATRDARKLIEQDNVDVLIGSGSTPSSIAITAVCHEMKVPCITIAPVNMPGEAGSWMISIPQPPGLMVAVVVDYMKAAGVKSVGYIGYNDGWGDLVYGGLEHSAAPDGIKILTNERYARTDTSVTAQALDIVSAQPDAVMTGGSGTPGRCRSSPCASAAIARRSTARRRSSIPISSVWAAPRSRGSLRPLGRWWWPISSRIPIRPKKCRWNIRPYIRRSTTNRPAVRSLPTLSMPGWCFWMRPSALWRLGRNPARPNFAARCVTRLSALRT